MYIYNSNWNSRNNFCRYDKKQISNTSSFPQFIDQYIFPISLPNNIIPYGPICIPHPHSVSGRRQEREREIGAVGGWGQTDKPLDRQRQNTNLWLSFFLPLRSSHLEHPPARHNTIYHSFFLQKQPQNISSLNTSIEQYHANPAVGYCGCKN